MPELSLFPREDRFSDQRKTLGHAEIQYKDATSILTPASGFMAGYDFTLNPYSGCSFGCNYCYAASFVKEPGKKENWGGWVDVKRNALDLLKTFRKKPIINKTIYISSVTDPYQPIEKDLKLTRDLLDELAKHHQAKIVIQTRSPLIERDLDILSKFKDLQVNMTVTTDSERIRKMFEPYCTANQKRIEAIKALSAAGLRTCITMTPLLPVEDPVAFAQSLKDSGATHFIVQEFHDFDKKFSAGTPSEINTLLKAIGWNSDSYRTIVAKLTNELPGLTFGKQGFEPRFESDGKIKAPGQKNTGLGM